MYRSLFMCSLLVVAAMAGCFGGDDSDDKEASGTTGPAPDPELSYKVILRNYTSEGLAGEPINVTWEVMPAFDASNATNQSVTVSHTNVHWGNESVPNPYTGEEPGTSVTPTASSTLSPTSSAPPTTNFLLMTTHATSTSTSTAPPTTGTGGTTAANATGGASQGEFGEYPNETEDQVGVAPSRFNASFLVDGEGLVYLRAHAIVGNKSFWSDEVVVNVTANATVPLGETHRVTVGAALPGQFASYSPAAVTIKLGDQVEWQNADRLFPHTATSREGAPQAFDTGNMPANTVSKPVHFTVAGTYTYGCTVHPSMAPATIRVA